MLKALPRHTASIQNEEFALQSRDARLMDNQTHLRKDAGQVRLPLNVSNSVLLTVNQETPLGIVADRLQDQHYVVAINDSGKVTGIASRSQIEERLELRNRFERNRWEQMPLATLLSATFGDSRDSLSVDMQEIMACSPIAEDGRLFGLAIEEDIFVSWRRLETLFSAALSDSLTGLLSRLAYERRLSEEWCRASRTGSSVAVVIVDLDDFKRVNDTLGHPAGDLVLRSVACELEMSLRSYDVVARFGGDEFVALCLGCDPGQIVLPIERVLQGIAGLNLTFDECPIPVSASIGAAVRHDGFHASDPHDLFAAADECLYHAKASVESAWKVELGVQSGGLPEPVGRFSDSGSSAEAGNYPISPKPTDRSDDQRVTGDTS